METQTPDSNVALSEEVEQLERELANKRAEAERIKAAALADIVSDPTKAVSTKISEEVVSQINSDETTQEKVAKVAEKIVDHGLTANVRKAEAVEHRASSEAKDADFENNKAEYLHHGVDHKVPKWQSKMMIAMNNVWFVILSTVFFFTFIPFSMFMSRIKSLSGILKFVAITIGIICLLAMLFGLTVWVLKLCGINLW